VCSEDAALYEIAEARNQGIKIKGEDAAPAAECPVCHKSPCRCADEIDAGEKPRVRLHSEGSPAQAFQALSDQCADQSIPRLRSLFVRVEGSGAAGARELRSLGLAIPQMGKGVYRIEQSLSCEFTGDEALTLTFRGGWERYKRLKPVTDAFAGEAQKGHVNVIVRADFPDGLEIPGPQFEAIRDVLANLELGKVVLDAEPAEAGGSRR
jgi:hypothetical protein